jgi:hypothetical protein
MAVKISDLTNLMNFTRLILLVSAMQTINYRIVIQINARIGFMCLDEQTV